MDFSQDMALGLHGDGDDGIRWMSTEDLEGLVPNAVSFFACCCYLLVVYLNGHIGGLSIDKYALQNWFQARNC